jgi:hypothetical protein
MRVHHSLLFAFSLKVRGMCSFDADEPMLAYGWNLGQEVCQIAFAIVLIASRRKEMRVRVVMSNFCILEWSDFSDGSILVFVENIVEIFPYVFVERVESCESAGDMMLSLRAVY